MYSKIRMVNPALLVSHPKNLEIYGYAIDADLERSILEVGILQAIIADESSMTILSGNSRCRIALKHGHEAVPVQFVDCEPDDEQIRMLIELNAQREKTTAQKAREFKELVAVKERQAKARQRASGGDKKSEASKKTPPKPRETDAKSVRAQMPEPIPESEKGRAKSEAAAEVGMGRKTAEKAADVVDEIDAANAVGDAEYAATLEHKLNNESVAAAHREVEKHKAETGKPKNKRKMAKEPKSDDAESTEVIPLDALKRPVPEHLREAHSRSASFGPTAHMLENVKKNVANLAALRGGEFLPIQQIEIALRDVKRLITQARYWSECPRCKGAVDHPKCTKCDGAGFLPFSRKGQLSADDKAHLGIK